MSQKTPEMLRELEGLLDSSRADMVRMQAELTAIPAIDPASGGEGEARKAGYLKAELTRIGCAALEVRAPDPRAPAGYRPNLIVWPEGMDLRDPARERVWVLTHTDVVPPGERRLWSHDPFTVHEEDGRLYGRGVEDNQQSLVSSVFALKAAMNLAAKGARLTRIPCLALVADEETGSAKGLGYLLEHRRDLFGPRDLIIVPDAGSQDGSEIEVAEKSILWLKLTLRGRQCHASRPAKGINTLEATARLIVALTELRRLFPARDPLFEPPESTFEATKKEANVPNINTIPGEDVFYLDSRVLPQYPLDDVMAQIRRIADDVAKATGTTVEMEPAQRAEAPAPTPADARVVKAIARALRELRGVEARPVGIGGGTVAALFRRVGLPAAVWSTLLEVAHQPDECCLIDNMVADSKTFAHIFLQD